MIEQIRQEFEEWYEKQGLDPHAKWHPAETLEFQQDKYPNGRYTVMSTKQFAWEIWQGAVTAIKDKYVLAPMEATPEMLEAASPSPKNWRANSTSIAIREWAQEERAEEYRNIMIFLKEQQL